MAYRLYIAEDYEQTIQQILDIDGQNGNALCASICCISMLVERTLDLSFPPDLCAHFASRCGVSKDLTDSFQVLAGAVSGRFSLKLTICGEDDAISKVKDGGKAIVQFSSSADGQMKYYLFDHYNKNTFYMVNPSLQQGKGLPRSKKRLIQQSDEYTLIPLESYRVFYPEDARYYVYSI